MSSDRGRSGAGDDNVLVTICARGGSKGVPRKNLRPLDGVPLIVHTIRVAREWGGASRIVVSTDDEAIANVAMDAGVEVPFMRPAELASDTAGKWGVIRHAAEQLERDGRRFDFVVDLDPTAPLRIVADIEGCVELFRRERPDAVITATAAYKNPYFNMIEIENGLAVLCKRPPSGIARRQDAPKVFAMNASIYVLDRDYLFRADALFDGRLRPFIMPADRSVDIDREIDFRLVEILMEDRRMMSA